MDTLQQKQLKILLIGDACTDVYVMGRCERLSPEAPVPVFLKKEEYAVKGMSENVFENLKNMLDAEISYFSNNSEDIIKTRFIDDRTKQHVLRYDIEKEVEPLDVNSLPSQNFDAVVVSDYNKGYISTSSARAIADKYSCTVFVDTKKSDLSCYEGCVVKLNEKESKSSNNKDKVTLIETLGADGARFNGKDYETDVVEVHDVCGAGDVFLSAMIASWLTSKNMEKAIKIANVCAAYSVTKLGTYVLSRDEYEKIKREQDKVRT